MKCSRCGVAIAEAASFVMDRERLCPGCLVERGQAVTKLTPEERKRLKEAVEQDMGGIFPLAPLRRLLDDGYAKLATGDYDEEANKLAREIQRMAAVALARHILDVIESMKSELSRQEEMIRRELADAERLG